jgi:hypothetical protein
LLVWTAVAHGQNVFVEPFVGLIRETSDIKPGQYIWYELPLEARAKFVVEFHVRGGLSQQINVWLTDPPNFQQFKAGQQFKVLRGTSGLIRGVARYEVVVPETGQYYLVLDNRRAILLNRQVYVYAFSVPLHPTRESVDIQSRLQQAYEGLKKIFNVRDFRIVIRSCGKPLAYSDPDIHLCLELMQELYDKGQTNAIGFVLFHELAHTLLRLWDYPGWDNEDIADEIATVLVIMGKFPEAAKEAAEWFQTRDSWAEARGQLLQDDRHTLSVQRARNILRWVDEGNSLLRRWQKLLVPNMQTDVLKALGQSREAWIDHALIRAELARR